MRNGTAKRVQSGNETARQNERPQRRRFVAGVMPKNYVNADELRLELQRRVNSQNDRLAEDLGAEVPQRPAPWVGD